MNGFCVGWGGVDGFLWFCPSARHTVQTPDGSGLGPRSGPQTGPADHQQTCAENGGRECLVFFPPLKPPQQLPSDVGCISAIISPSHCAALGFGCVKNRAHMYCVWAIVTPTVHRVE